ncbi:MAG: hypothetical protein PUC82_03660 [bacterium]|nr:hypothetical protein [bacterium]
MKFENVVAFPEEMEAYMIVRNKLGLTEEEYLGLSLIERRELAVAYRTAKRLGLMNLDELRDGYKDTAMFDEDGAFDLASATMIIKTKLGVLSLAKTKLGIKDSMDDFILKGDKETSSIAEKVREAYAVSDCRVVPHLSYLVEEESNTNIFSAVNNKFEFN